MSALDQLLMIAARLRTVLWCDRSGWSLRLTDFHTAHAVTPEALLRKLPTDCRRAN